MTLERLLDLAGKATPGLWRPRRHEQRQYRYVEFDRNGYTTCPLEPADARWIAETQPRLLRPLLEALMRERDAIAEDEQAAHEALARSEPVVLALRQALQHLAARSEAALACYYGGQEQGCDHRGPVVESVASARALLARSEPVDVLAVDE